MKKNEKLVKAMLLVPLATAVVTAAAVPWQTGYTPGYSFGLTAYASDLATERVRINLNELKTDFDADSGVTATLDEAHGIYKITLAGGQKYLIEGSNYINDSYVDVMMKICDDADVYFDHVYIKNDNGKVATSVTAPVEGEERRTSYSLSNTVTPLQFMGSDAYQASISGNLTLDVFHGKLDDYAEAEQAISGTPSLQNMTLVTNGECDCDDYNKWDSGSMILSSTTQEAIGDAECATFGILEPELDGKQIKGYRLYQQGKVMKTIMPEKSMAYIGSHLKLSLANAALYEYDAIEILLADGSSEQYKRFDVKDAAGDLYYRVFCKEDKEVLSLLPRLDADHVIYSFENGKILCVRRDHTEGEWKLDASGNGVRTCLYCDLEMDVCKHQKSVTVPAERIAANVDQNKIVLKSSERDQINELRVDLGENNDIYNVTVYGCDSETEPTLDWFQEQVENGELKSIAAVKSDQSERTLSIDISGEQQFPYYYVIAKSIYYWITPPAISASLYHYASTIETRDAVGETCSTAGYTPQVCSVCGLTVAKTGVGATTKNHHVIYHEAVPATCQQAGRIAYWECMDCQRYYRDAECREEITEADLVEPKTEHVYSDVYRPMDLEAHAIVCDVCEEASTSWVLHRFEYRYGHMVCRCGMEQPELTAAAEQITYGQTDTLTVQHIEASGLEGVQYQWYEKLTDAAFDKDALTDPKQYLPYAGETAVTMTTPKTLPAGEHTLVCVMTCGDSTLAVEKTITVTKAAPSKELFSDTVNAGGVYTGKAYETVVAPKSDVTGLGEMLVKYIRTDAAGNRMESTEAPVKAGSYQVVASVTEGMNYTAGEVILGTTVISKAVPAYTAPGKQTLTCQQTLKDIVLPAGFTLSNADQKLTAGKDNPVKLIYTPADTANYDIVQNIEMIVTVAAHAYGAPTYEWSVDGKQCKLVFTCGVCTAAVDGHSFTVDGTVTSQVKTPATETTMGTTTYTVTYGQYTDTKDVADIPMLEKKADTAQTVKPAKKGTKLKCKQGSFKVTKASVKNPQVSYQAPKSKKVKIVKVPDTVQIDGVTYKVTSIAKNAFKNYKNLQIVTVGDRVTTIGDQAFAGCKHLTTITIGKNVTKLGKRVFIGCDKLKSITMLTTKLTKKSIGKYTFKGLTESVEIEVPKKKLKTYTNLFYDKGLSRKVKIKKK